MTVRSARVLSSDLFPGLLFIAGALFIPSGPASSQETAVGTDPWNRAATGWVDLLRSGDFEGAASRVDPEVPQGRMGAEQLQAIWGQVGGQLGDLVLVEPGLVTEQGKYHLVDLPATFENGEVTIRVVLTDAEEVSGFFFRPPEPPAYEAPDYVSQEAFHEVEVELGAEPWKLPGVFTFPDQEEPVPGVVLVHGSGPNDRDETVGGNRPFRDLAWGLASAGIAVLRYDKRTRAHQTRLPSRIGLDEEVVEDALFALALARDRPEIDPHRVYLLGHSLGGMMAPEIARRDGAVAGVIVLAGPARPFQEVLVGQLEYIASLEADPESPARAQLDSLLAVMDRYATGELGPDELLLGARVGYWRELEEVDPVATAAALSEPFYVAQGGRDYQVTDADLELWRSGLAARSNVTLELYPSLNHLFAPGTDKATPAEYTSQVKHVDPEVIEDLAAWIIGRGG